MKKEILIALLLISVVIIAGCSQKTADTTKDKQIQPGDPSLDTSLDDNSTLDDLDVNLDESSV